MSAVREFYARLGITLMRSAGSEAPARCFASPDAHRRDDRHPSVSVNLDSGAWLCHGCGARGGAYDAALLRGHTPRSAMDLLISHGLADPRHRGARPPRPTATRSGTGTEVCAAPGPLVDPEQVTGWHRALTARPDLVDRLARERGIGPQILARFEIGSDGTRITIPVRSADGNLTGLLRWLPFRRGTAPKMLAIPGSRRDLFPPPEQLADPAILICEGEPDALAAHTAGIPAVAMPGVAAWRSSWTTRFKGRDVTVALDCDPEGRACAARVADDLARAGISVTVVDLSPERNDGYDLIDHLLGGGSIGNLRR